MKFHTANDHGVITDLMKESAATRQSLVDFCESLRKKEDQKLGFIPAIAYEQAAERKRLMVVTENDEPAGFVFWAYRRRKLRFHQTAVVEELRRLKHATSLVTTILNSDQGRAATQIGLRVRDDLPANEFWKALGFRVDHQEPGGKTWGRMINIYKLDVRCRIGVAEKFIDGVLTLRQNRLDKDNECSESRRCR